LAGGDSSRAGLAFRKSTLHPAIINDIKIAAKFGMHNISRCLKIFLERFM
jgi:hypothetical protein